MARPPFKDDEALSRAQEVLRNSTDPDEVKAAQAYLLPAEGVSLDITASALGRDRYWVSRARNRFLKGKPPLKHGGRRNELMSEAEEVALVKAAFIKTLDGPFGKRLSSRATLKVLLDERLGHVVSDSTITEMLGRMLRRYVPDAQVEHLEAFERSLGMLFNAENRVNGWNRARQLRMQSEGPEKSQEPS